MDRRRRRGRYWSDPPVCLGRFDPRQLRGAFAELPDLYSFKLPSRGFSMKLSAGWRSVRRKRGKRYSDRGQTVSACFRNYLTERSVKPMSEWVSIFRKCCCRRRDSISCSLTWISSRRGGLFLASMPETFHQAFEMSSWQVLQCEARRLNHLPRNLSRRPRRDQRD